MADRRPSDYVLVEVSNDKDTKQPSGKTPQPSPLLGPRSSPAFKPQNTPARSPALEPKSAPQDWRVEHKRRPKQVEDGPLDKEAAAFVPSVPEGSAEGDENKDPSRFDPSNFVGDWTDSLGHRISVHPADRGGRRRSRGKFQFSAFLSRDDDPGTKRFGITYDQRIQEWMCGNGVLVPEDSGTQEIYWKTADGRISKWERVPPSGPVYFDPPPLYAIGDFFSQTGMMLPPYGGGGATHYDPPTFVVPAGMQDVNGVVDANGATVVNGGANSTEDVDEAKPRMLSAAAPEFVMPVMDVPSGMQFEMPAEPAVPDNQIPRLEEETDDMRVIGTKIEWILPDAWGKLNRFPKDFCITSPMFGVAKASNMQLVFYPNGNKAADKESCTVGVTQAAGSQGIKFEFSVNSRRSGPKVCLGKKYHGDLRKPFAETEETKLEQVIVAFHIIEIIGSG